MCQSLLHLIGRHALELSVYGLYPRAAELAFGRRLAMKSSADEEEQKNGK